MARLPDWERRLSTYLARCRDRAFAWGEHDCVLFACGAVEAVTGEDPAAEYRGRYGNRKGSAAILKAQGKGTLLKTVGAAFKPRRPAFARRGDLVWFDGSVGVCIGAEALFVGEERLLHALGKEGREGLVTVPRARWTKAWAV